jgi:hypothetical protein
MSICFFFCAASKQRSGQIALLKPREWVSDPAIENDRLESFNAHHGCAAQYA